jgi:hypothetical protein
MQSRTIESSIYDPARLKATYVPGDIGFSSRLVLRPEVFSSFVWISDLFLLA